MVVGPSVTRNYMNVYYQIRIQELEGAINRHLEFIDGLLSDKEQLNAKVLGLVLGLGLGLVSGLGLGLGLWLETKRRPTLR